MDTENLVTKLKAVPLFSQLPDKILQKIVEISRIETFEPEQLIIEEGKAGDRMFLILSGNVAVEKRDSAGTSNVLTFFGQGECIGELALIDDAPRSASVRSIEPVRTLSIAKKDFIELLRENPDLMMGLFRVLTCRLRETANLLNTVTQQEVADKLKEEVQKEQSSGRGLSMFGRILNIRLPQSGRTVGDYLNDLGDVTDEDGLRLLGQRDVSDNLLAHRLEEAGVLSRSQVMLAMRKASQSGHTFVRTLINMKLLSLREMQNWLTQIRREQTIAPEEEERLLDLLLEKGVIDSRKKEEILTTAQRDEKPVYRVLAEMGVLSPGEIVKILELPDDIELVNVDPATLDMEVVNSVAYPVLLENEAIPLKYRDGKLETGMLDPLDRGKVQSLEFFANTRIVPRQVTRKNYQDIIRHLLEKWDPDGKGVAVDKVSGLDSSVELRMVGEDIDQLDETSRKYIQNVRDEMVEQAIAALASDIHIEPQDGRNRVRFRIDGVLHDITSYSMPVHKSLVSAIKLQAEMDIANHRIPQDGKFVFSDEGNDVVVRVSSLPTSRGEKLVLRIHQERDVTLGLRELGLTDTQFIKMESLAATPYGMMLVVGPVGSGKSTTLYSLLHNQDVLERNIITIEDPIEYELPGINHVQVNTKAGLDYVTGLKSILRQDPDVVMLGEIRDVESARIATRAACTGVLLLSTMHTNDAPSTVTALFHLGVEPYFIVNSLIGVVAQRLVRRICPNCRQEYQADLPTIDLLRLDREKEYVLYRGRGCGDCFHTGFKGRVGIFEIMRVSEKIRELILAHAPESEIKEQAVREGMTTLRQSAVLKVLEGITSVDELFRVTVQDEIDNI